MIASRNFLIITGLFLSSGLGAMTIAVRPYLEQDSQTGEYHIVRYPRAGSTIRSITELPTQEYSTKNVVLDIENSKFAQPGDLCVYGEFDQSSGSNGIIACKSGLLFENVSKLIGGSTETPWLNYPSYIGRSTYGGSKARRGMPIFSPNDIIYLKSKSPVMPRYTYED